MADETVWLLHIFMRTFAFAFFLLLFFWRKQKMEPKKYTEPKKKMTLDAAVDVLQLCL